MFDEHLTKKEKLFMGVIGVLVIIGMIMSNIQYNKDVEECVEHGQNRQVCEIGLR